MGKGKRNRALRKTKSALGRIGVKTNGMFDAEFTRRWSQDEKFRKRVLEGEFLDRIKEDK